MGGDGNYDSLGFFVDGDFVVVDVGIGPGEGRGFFVAFGEAFEGAGGFVGCGGGG